MEQTKNRLTLKGIQKWYPKPTAANAVHALKEIDIEFTEEIYCLTGRNGAGKSTLMNILTGYLLPDAGSILWNGDRINTRTVEYKKLLGYMPQQQCLYESMNCLQFMGYMASLKGMTKKEMKKNIDELLETVHLTDKRNTKIAALSGGMKQRLLFAQSILGNPKLLILDEPTAGIDPEERESIHSIIQLHSKGKIVLMSTHILSDLERLAQKEIHMELGTIVDCKKAMIS